MDYSKYTIEQLNECLIGIDKEKYPDNYQSLLDEISKREIGSDKNNANQIKIVKFHFVRRIFALVLDMLFLAIVGVVVINLFRQTISEIGSLARIIGYVIAGAYFVLLESRIGKGHTIGQFILKIRVVNDDQSYLSISQSVFRFNVAFFFYFLDGMFIDFFSGLSKTLSIINSAYICIIILNVYSLATTKFKFTLTDLITKTQINGKNSPPRIRNSIWAPHYYIQIVISLAIMAYTIIPTKNPISKLQGLDDAYSALVKFTKSNNIQVSDNLTTFASTDGSKTVHTYMVTLINPRETNADSVYAKKIAKIAFETDKSARQSDKIAVNVTQSVSIGIYTQNNNSSYSFTPEEINANK